MAREELVDAGTNGGERNAETDEVPIEPWKIAAGLGSALIFAVGLIGATYAPDQSNAIVWIMALGFMLLSSLLCLRFSLKGGDSDAG